MVDRVTSRPNRLGESPLWHDGEQALYWVDIPEGEIHCLTPGAGTQRQWRIGEPVGCIALDRDGGLVAGTASGFAALAADGDVLRSEWLATPIADQTGIRMNDGCCDRQGRFWAGSMRDPPDPARPDGALYRLDSDGTCRVLLSGLLVPNGLAFSPDGRTMYLSDSHPSVQKIWAFDFDPDDGVPLDRRLFADMTDLPGRPDGAAVDADGCYWIAANDGWSLIRFTPDGRIDRTVRLPVAKPSKCAFGGPGLASLFVTSIRPEDPDALAGQPWAGCLFQLDPKAVGCPEPRFGGPAGP